MPESTSEFEAFWWCDHCFATKSAVQVNYDETCTLCGQPVTWIETPKQAKEHGVE